MPVHDWTRVDAGVFHDFHTAWMVALRNVLNGGLLPEGFYALAEQSAGIIGPDVLTLERRHGEVEGNGAHGPCGKMVATAPPKVKKIYRREAQFYLAKQRRLAIRHRSEDRLVAILEIVSEGNKSSAFRTFLEKAAGILEHGINLMLLDLYPPAARDPQGVHHALWDFLGEKEEPAAEDKALTLASYAAGSDITAYVEPIAVGDYLPDMPLFLTSEEYIDVPLERTYAAAWQGVPGHLQKLLA